MRFSYWPAPGAGWPELLQDCLAAEACGWDGVWFSDHLMPAKGDPCAPINESFTTLAALAASVPRLRLGHMVAGNTYRHPALVAKMAAGMDRISGGRFVLGVGAGWQANEHRAYGIPFFDTPARMSRLDEACSVIRRLLTNEMSTYDGRHYQLKDAPLSPKPLQARLPILIGGGGERLLLRIAARHADEWNVFADPELLRHKNEVLARHCDAIGRDPSQIKRSVVLDLPPEDRDNDALIQQRLEAYTRLGVNEIVVRGSLLRARNESQPAALETFITRVAAEFH